MVVTFKVILFLKKIILIRFVLVFVIGFLELVKLS